MRTLVAPRSMGRVRCLRGLACAVLTAALAPALGAETVVVSGVLATTDGRALPHVVLALTSPSTETSRFVTGPEGQFRAHLSPGAYEVTIDAPGLVVLEPSVLTVPATVDGAVRIRAAAAPIREHVLVTATRGEALESTLGVSTTVLDRRQLEERAPETILRAIEEVPGVAVARSGGIGPQASAFVRGGESSFVRVLIDGVPMNEPGGIFNFGTLLPFEIEQIEVVRGATSSLYGSDALAGAVHLVSRRAMPGEAPILQGEGAGGSFETWRGSLSTMGDRNGWRWNAGAQRLETANEQPNSAFSQTVGAASLSRGLGAATELRFSGRADSSVAGVPGPTLFQRPDLDASHERSSFVGSLSLRHSRGPASHEIRVGHTRIHQLSLNPDDSGPYTPRYDGAEGYAGSDYPNPEGYQNDTWRVTAGYQMEIQVGRIHLLTGGLELEREGGEIGDRRGDLLGPTRTNGGGYVQDRMVFADRLFVTVGGRVEHNGSFGTHVVPRAAVAWRLRGGADATTLTASAGAGIKEPSLLQSYGVSTYARGNPDLKPERSRTFDAGVEQRLFDGRARGEVTFFRHDYLDQIAYFVESYDPFTGSYDNLGRTRAQGVELSVTAVPVPQLTIRGNYTYLDGEVVESAPGSDPIYAVGQPLLRRPRHQGLVSARLRLGRWAAGAMLTLVGARADSDFAGLGLTENEGHGRLDARMSYEIGDGVEVFAEGENLTNAESMEILGYPMLGRSLRGGVRVRLGGTARP